LSNFTNLVKFDNAIASPIIIFSIGYDWQWACISWKQSMLRIRRSSNGEVLFALSGRIGSEHVAELESLIRAEANGRRIVIDLKDVTLAGEDGIIFLARCEAGNITLVNCLPYIREWITRQNNGS
jgi:hypothetical protein